jgi:activating signal cointegrator 1
MNAISLWQPWASLWLTDRKVHETRGWEHGFRGPLLVHAAQRRLTRREYDGLPREFKFLCTEEFGGHWALDLPYGAIIGQVELLECVPTKQRAPAHADDRLCGDFGPERYAWARGEYWRFPRPIPYRGRQRFFTVPNTVIHEAIAA